MNNNVYRDGSRIKINNLNSPQVLSDFTSAIKYAVYKCGYQDITVDINTKGSLYPNTLVPMCGILNYFSDLGIGVLILENGRVPFKRSILTTFVPSLDQSDIKRPLSKIWKFENTADIYDIQSAIIAELRKEDEFAQGVLEGIEWSINEIMDNVLNHSQAGVGFIMSQLHITSKHVAFTIFDSGIGIYNSFKGSKHIIRSNADALSLCLQEGVTRDSKVGQGNGMCGLFSLIKEGNGILNISSGRDTYRYWNGETSITNDGVCSLSKDLGCTTVDFQLDYSSDISIDRVLTFQGKTFTFTNLFIDNLEDDNGVLVFKVAEMSEGTGTREAALRLKNQIINSIRDKRKRAIIDFEGVNVVASSYIDELIAKLLIELGLFQFNQRISLHNISELLQKALQKSVIQRIIEDYS
jgi:hypothetical protein